MNVLHGRVTSSGDGLNSMRRGVSRFRRWSEPRDQGDVWPGLGRAEPEDHWEGRVAVKTRLCAACGEKKAGGRSLTAGGNVVDICADCCDAPFGSKSHDAVRLIFSVMAEREAHKHSGGYRCNKTGGFVDVHESRCPHCGDENPNYAGA